MNLKDREAMARAVALKYMKLVNELVASYEGTESQPAPQGLMPHGPR